MLVRLEMDAKLVTFLLFKDLPVWSMVLILSAHFTAGISLGVLYFRTVWWNARLFSLGGRVATSLLLVLVRFALLASFLTLASLEGALPLLVLALGILSARVAILRAVRRSMP